MRMGVKRRILLRYFLLLPPTSPWGDDATKVMVPSETEQPESLRDARDLWSVVTTTFYYFPSDDVSRATTERREVEAATLSGDEGGR